MSAYYETFPDEYMPNSQIRPIVKQWVQSGHGTWAELCHHTGLIRTRRGHTHAESSRLQRMLGLRMTGGSAGRADYMNRSIKIEMVLQLLDYMGLDPRDVEGL